MVLALLCGDAAAQSVHKCVAKTGAVSYQSAPCAAGSREAQAWPAPPEPAMTAQRQRELDAKLRRDREESEFLSRRAGTDPASVRVVRSGRAVPEPECEAAKARRQRKLDEVGLRRTFEVLSRLDEQVRKACR